MPTHDHDSAPISKDEIQALVVAAVRTASAEHAGEAAAVVAALQKVYQRWAQDWVTSEMGGGGGTGIYDKDTAIFLWYQSLGREWDVKLEWRAGRWTATAMDPIWGTEGLDEFNTAELPLAEAFMAGLHFDSPNAYRWKGTSR